MSGLAEPFRKVVLTEPDHNPDHHAKKCVGRGMNDLGHEGAVLFKRNGKYYLGAADNYEGRYSTCLAISDNVYGPYQKRHESIPCGGGTGFFKVIGGAAISAMTANLISGRKSDLSVLTLLLMVWFIRRKNNLL